MSPRRNPPELNALRSIAQANGPRRHLPNVWCRPRSVDVWSSVSSIRRASQHARAKSAFWSQADVTLEGADLPILTHSGPFSLSLCAATFSDSNLLPCGGRLAFRRLRDREHLAHILGERLAKAFGIAREWAPFVPVNDQWFAERFAQMRYADDSQRVAIVRRSDGMIATPCPASASASKVWGARLSSRMLGSTRARRQAALNILRSE